MSEQDKEFVPFLENWWHYRVASQRPASKYTPSSLLLGALADHYMPPKYWNWFRIINGV